MSRAQMIAAIAVAAQLVAGAAVAQAPPVDGKALFHEKCAMCHGPGGMGTGLLVRRVQPPELEKRDNLNAAYVFQYARRGLGNMPPIPPGEANDIQLRAIGDYLARGRK